MGQNVKRLRMVSILLFVVHVGWCEIKAADASSAVRDGLPRQERKFVISRVEPESLSPVTIEDLRNLWPMFQHVPYAESGSCHLVLPFHTSTNAPHAVEEARAFAFLLSNALDWVPGNYCARHAYFTFKRARNEMLTLEQRYDSLMIAAQMGRWRATHAIGGDIQKDGNGYVGRLLIFGKNGSATFERKYDRPQTYFDLLGDMSDDCMKHMRSIPSPSLRAHIRKPRCRNEESLWDLGAAAFEDERGGKEFQFYRRILERDPGFSEVRYWIANQGAWAHDNWQACREQEMICLSNYLTEAVLAGFSPSRRDLPIYQTYVDQGASLVGESSPTIVACRLELALAKREMSRAMMEQALEIARQNPNHNGILHGVRHTLWDAPRGPVDGDMTISIILTQLQNQSMPGSSDQTMAVIAQLTEILTELGRSDVALPLAQMNLAPAFNDDDLRSKFKLLIKLGDLYRLNRLFPEALEVYRSLGEHPGRLVSYDRDMALSKAAICALLLGKVDAAKAFAGRRRCSSGTGWSIVLDNYFSLVEGRPVDIPQLLIGENFHVDTDPDVVTLLAETDLAKGTTNYRQRLIQHLEMQPNDREKWVLFDAYDRVQPQLESGLFYETLAWIHPESKWVMGAVDDYRKRARGKAVPDTAGYMTVLQRWSSDPWPGLLKERDRTPLAKPIPLGGVAMGAKMLVAEGRRDEARELIHRCQKYLYGKEAQKDARGESRSARAFYNHLLYRMNLQSYETEREKNEKREQEECMRRIVVGSAIMALSLLGLAGILWWVVRRGFFTGRQHPV